MAPAAGADANGEPSGIDDVIDDVVGSGFIGADPRRDKVKIECMSRTPCNVMVSARGIAAHTHGADQLSLRVIERQASAKYIHSADATADHGVVRLAVVVRVAPIGDECSYRIALLQSEQAATRLDCAVKVRRRKRQGGQAECIRGICFLSGDYAASRPLAAAIAAGEGHCAHHSVAIHNRAPHVQAESAVRLLLRQGQGRLQLAVGGKRFARR